MWTQPEKDYLLRLSGKSPSDSGMASDWVNNIALSMFIRSSVCTKQSFWSSTRSVRCFPEDFLAELNVIVFMY